MLERERDWRQGNCGRRDARCWRGPGLLFDCVCPWKDVNEGGGRVVVTSGRRITLTQDMQHARSYPTRFPPAAEEEEKERRMRICRLRSCFRRASRFALRKSVKRVCMYGRTLPISGERSI